MAGVLRQSWEGFIWHLNRPARVAVLFLSVLCAFTASYSPLRARTRDVYQGPNDKVITARSMDWKVDVGTNLWIFPRLKLDLGKNQSNTYAGNAVKDSQ